MAGTPATIPAATPPDPSKVANNRTAKSRNTCFEPFYATSALVESCPLRETRNNRSFAEFVVGRRLTVILGPGARDTPKGAFVGGASYNCVLLGFAFAPGVGAAMYFVNQRLSVPTPQ